MAMPLENGVLACVRIRPRFRGWQKSLEAIKKNVSPSFYAERNKPGGREE